MTGEPESARAVERSDNEGEVSAIFLTCVIQFSRLFLFRTIPILIHASIEVLQLAQGFALILLTIKLCERR